jgi:hypothetical protein
MTKKYSLTALWPLLPFEEKTTFPLVATLEPYGGDTLKYAVTDDGIWLCKLPPASEMLSDSERESVTGYRRTELAYKKIDGLGYVHALQGGEPLLPLPFTRAQLIEFENRQAGLISSCIERGDDTDDWITSLEQDNPDAAELARGIHGGVWPEKLPEPDAGLAIKPMQRQPAQDETIMQAISNLGLYPMNLQQPKGKAGDKAKIRDSISNMSDETFNKAWKRLRKDGRIR